MRQNGLIIGVLGIQGDIEENVSQTRTAFNDLGKKGTVRIVRYATDFPGLSGLILPGGEDLRRSIQGDASFGNLCRHDYSVFQST